ncbi:Ohr family peroxiredoxin [Corynebacterium sp. A21]|uniref:Ohr family peroxiredoxin n=1 Tax=Corynebacterium sp. A21 TaxID=3457318 RepID=UPI003FD43B30
MAEILYTATATNTGGGRDGHVKGDAHIDFDVRPPKEMGGNGEGVNPEALVAAAWSSCYNGALQLMMKNHGIDVAAHRPEVTVEFSISKDAEGGLWPSGVLKVKFENVADLDNPAELLAEAHAFCPMSKALRGEAETKVQLA